ncbi:hypothetical protein JQS43_23500 [Natronosporangium hydrolyticum]|uniref:Uncharacterized protein n=1 Tax=Natronosporangium hydrolyticum TaxID=2811111 RepID=A0A895YAK8_9ACTN|nr:hypothetical protein [Natronosporangium hydrolyticum]QSB14421.1 hypothetical protein JQS43_23500 [Natronosporangium hydrolyticum]
MTLLPEHAQLLAQVHHQELVAAAQSYRRARWPGRSSKIRWRHWPRRSDPA